MDLTAYLRKNPYPGRGILIGASADGRWACAAYFIMGRSANSRNRVLAEEPDGFLRTLPFDETRMEDPSLIIYTAMRVNPGRWIVTNGDHTDTLSDVLASGGRFADALLSRSFEPDAPNYTPRISGMLTFAQDGFTYDMGILKALDPAGTACGRYHFRYPSMPGAGRLLHTYQGDGYPLPAFEGEPRAVALGSDMEELAGEIWEALDHENRVSLYLRAQNLKTGETVRRLYNQRQEEMGWTLS